MNVLERADAIVIERIVEPVAWRIEHATGTDHFRQGQYILVGLPFGAYASLTRTGDKYYTLMLALTCGIGILAIIRYFLVDMFGRPASRLGVSWERHSWWLRVPWVVLVLSMVATSAAGLSSPNACVGPVTMLLHHWWCACNAAPPKQDVRVPDGVRRVRA